METPCFLVLWAVVGFADAQTATLFDKPGRCAAVSVKCSRPSPSSRCFFHFECPGNQLCCSVDGCINACLDPVNDTLTRTSYEMSSQISDEAHAHNESAIPATSYGGYFRCRSGLVIQSVYRCDGKSDCADGSDEADCPCAANQTSCANGLCIDTATLCSPVGSRNLLCPVQNLDCSSTFCSTDSHFRCQNGQCVSLASRCDGVFSCLDGSDEQGCVCNRGNFNCDAGLCKSTLNVWCNGIADCLDHTDEPNNCSCVPGQFRCSNNRCIPQYKKCDFNDDCLDGSDEVSCPTKCSKENNLFQCHTGQCVARSLFCDGNSDCHDGSDEGNCSAASLSHRGRAVSCVRNDQFSCDGVSENKCISLSAWCDGVSDCSDQSDEPFNCSHSCPKNGFQCDGGRCMTLDNKCDGKADCLDGADESGCQCQLNELPLPQSSCLISEKFCDGKADSASGLDEEQCTCQQRIKRQSTGKLCDGVIDCPDCSDELSCGSCTTAQFYCIRSQQCIFRNQTCDGYADCPYGEDEEMCLGMVPQPCHIESDMQVRQERAGCLTVNNRGDWMPVCAERWSSSLSDAICEISGYDKSVTTNLIAMEPGEMPERPIDQKIPRQIDGPQIIISAARNCPSRKKVYIECGQLLCGQTSSEALQPRSVNDYSVPDGKYPWTVALYHNGKYFCSGVIIAADWVITAAHCVVNQQTAYMVTRVGATRRSSMNQNEQFLPVDAVIIHPGYVYNANPYVLTADSDIALLHLSTPARWNLYVKPVCLTGQDLPAKVVVTAWSRAYGRALVPTDDVLQEATFTTTNSTLCGNNLLVEGGVTDNMFCVSFAEVKNSTCPMDNGGAALKKDDFGRWNLVGIGSFALGCSGVNSVGVFLSLASYLPWISLTIAIGNSSPNVTRGSADCPGGARCALGQCISPSQMCDGTVDCPLASDETNCSPVLPRNQTGNCSFSDNILCGYRQDLGDQLNWYRGNWPDARFFPNQTSSNTTSFLYISALMAGSFSGSSARLISPKLTFSSTVRCLVLRWITNDGTLSVYDATDTTRILKLQLESVADQQGDWVVRKVEVPVGLQTFVVDGRLGAADDSFLGFTDLSLQNVGCNTTSAQ